LWLSSLYYTEATATITLVFLAGQSCLSYFLAGVAKCLGHSWRDGTAVRDIFRTRSYGQSFLSRLLHRSPILAAGATWFALGFECSFPLVLVLPPPLSLIYLILGCLFHLVNAFAMGLNLFVWAYLATYPAVLYTASRLSATLWG
jgi:hypothetical protein